MTIPNVQSMSQRAHPLVPPPPPAAKPRRRLLWWTLGSLALVGALVTAGVVFLPSIARRILVTEIQIWTSESGLPPSTNFRYLLFPTSDAIAYDDAELSISPAPWSRVLLNQLHEQDSRAISARDAQTGAMRFVDGARMQLLPDDPTQVRPALDAFVELVGWKRNPRIERLAFRARAHDGVALVTLEVAGSRSTEIYEYSVTNGKVIPRRWTRCVPSW